MVKRVGGTLAAVVLLGASVAMAQTPAPAAQEPPATQAPAETRPATTTYWGDTGLWFVPTGEVLPTSGGRSACIGRTSTSSRASPTCRCGRSRSATGSGIAPRCSPPFARSRASTATRGPSFSRIAVGGLVNEYPVRARGLDRQRLRRPLIGAKINLLAEHRQQPRGAGAAGHAEAADGRATTKARARGRPTVFDFIVSKELNQRVELSRRSAASCRAAIPTTSSLTDGFRWGVRRGLPDADEPAAHGGAPRRVLLRRRR